MTSAVRRALALAFIVTGATAASAQASPVTLTRATTDRANFFGQTAVGDLDGDGDLDVASADTNSGVQIGLNDGRLGFTRRYLASYNNASGPRSLATVDIDGDGDLDLVATQTAYDPGDQDIVAEYLNDGTAIFAASAAQFLAPGSTVGDVVAGDFGRDGGGGYAYTQQTGGAGVVRQCSGAGACGAPYALPGPASDLTAGDVNGDGYLDVVMLVGGVPVIVLNGPDGFSTTRTAAVSGVVGVATGDLNADGRDDIAAATGTTVVPLISSAAGAPTAQPALATPDAAAVAIADLNGDGRPDLVTRGSGADGAAAAVDVGTTTGAGALTAPVPTADAGRGDGVVLPGDFDADGRVDVLSVNDDSRSLTALRNVSRGTGTFDPGALTFPGTTPATTRSAAQSVAFTNTGAAPVLVGSVRAVGRDADAFVVSEGCVGVRLVPGASCTVSVRFAPQAAGAAQAAVQVQSDADNMAELAVSATGADAPAPGAGAGGATGPKGDAGSTGSAGATGATGPKGDTGARGPAGRAGRDAKVTCRLKGKRKKVRCVVTYRGAKRAVLIRGGRIVARSRAHDGVLRFDGVRRGTYTLRARVGGATIERRLRVR